MGRKKSEVSIEVRKLIVHHFIGKKSIGNIAKMVNRSKSTVHNIIKHYKEKKTVEKLRRSGRPRIFNETEKRWIVRNIKKNPKLSAIKLKNEIEIILKKNVHVNTVRNVLKEKNFHSRMARKKPFISKVNLRKRFKFAIAHINKSVDFWRKVIFADESKYNIFGSDGSRRVWREPNTELDPRNLINTIKHGGGSQMVWGCMAASGVGNLEFVDERIDKKGYLNILKKNVKESARNLGLETIFQYYEDNDPKHNSDICRLWKLYNCPKVISAPPQSPDLNPIEHFWDYLEKKIRQYDISNKETLRTALLESWNNIDPVFCEKLVLSMPSRLREVIRRRGKATRY